MPPRPRGGHAGLALRRPAPGNGPRLLSRSLLKAWMAAAPVQLLRVIEVPCAAADSSAANFPRGVCRSVGRVPESPWLEASPRTGCADDKHGIAGRAKGRPAATCP